MKKRDFRQNRPSGREKTRFFSMRAAGVLLVLTIILLTVVTSSGLASTLNRVFSLSISIDTVGWILLFSIVVGTLGALGAAQFFIKPIKKLEAAMNKVAHGDFTVNLPTDRLKLREINALYENFNTMTAELSATEILQSDFVSNVSHEFKTPLSAVEGWASLLQDPTLGEEERQAYVERILTSTARLSELVANILLLSRIENKAIEDKKTTFRLDEQIRAALITLEPSWSAKDLEPEAELEEISFSGNEALLMHVWMNLLQNAVKFSPEGGKLEIRLSRDETGRVVFTVDDEGPGIPEAELSRIFNKFYQGDASRKAEGNGLGLALVQRVVTLSGGTVEAGQSPVLKGARFTVRL